MPSSRSIHPIKDIPADLLETFAIPAGMIAGFRNALAHTYDDIIDERVILTIREDLPALDSALAGMLKALEEPGGKLT
ncbi:MAG: DUF86 domain-containing protein [Alphaproteobacteria bacterium]